MKAISLFSCGGIGELLLHELGIEVLAANELIESRAKVFQHLYPETKMIIGDIRDSKIKTEIFKFKNNSPELLLATPPCQGLSTVGKNKVAADYSEDARNFLIFDIITIIKEFDFKYILIENVPKFLEMYYPYEGDLVQLIELLRKEIGEKYEVMGEVLNAKYYGVPQSRPRSIIKIFKKGLSWSMTKQQSPIPLSKSIGQLPSLNPGENSQLKWHQAKPQREDMTIALAHTPTGKSALKNEIFYPKNKHGQKVRGFHNTYKRMLWNEPAHARTTYNGSVSSHNNVHPGIKQKNGLYSDPRVLTILETLIVSTIPVDISFPDWISDSFLRTLIGEGVPPKFMYELIKPICRSK